MKNRFIQYAIAVIAGWFLFLCFLHYFSRRPLWLDEGLLFANIRDFSSLQLFGPLKNTQVFPRVYLALVKLVSQPFSYDVLALRFLPLAFMLAGVAIWIKIYRLAAKTGFFLILLCLSLACSHFTTYYAAEFKQYSCDLFAVALITLFVYYQAAFSRGEIALKKLWFFVVVTPFLVFFSYVSVLMLWIVGYNFVVIIRKNTEALSLLGVYLALTLSCFILSYIFDLRFSLGNPSMRDYWKDYFINTQSPYEFFKSLTEGMRNITVSWSLEKKWAMGVATVFMPFCWVAMVKYFIGSLKKNRGGLFDLRGLCAVLVGELFVLGVLQAYPFTGCRATLFIAPFIFYMIVEGIYLVRKVKFIFLPLAGTYIVFLGIVSYNLLNEYLKLYVQ